MEYQDLGTRIEKQRDISSLLIENDKLKLLSYEFYKQFTHDEIRWFCHFFTRYGLPTLELINFIKPIIENKKTIEIGAGSGDLGYHLGVPMTDSFCQEKPFFIMALSQIHQIPVKYGLDVEKIDALDAVKKYKPNIVISSWVTEFCLDKNFGEGVKEEKILDLVDMYIMIGNKVTHDYKKILKKRKFTCIKDPWILSRGKYYNENCIWIFEK